MDSMKGVIYLALFFCYVAGINCIPSYVICPNPDPLDHVVFFPHESNCTEFYRCDHGSALLQFCPSGLHWNPKLDTCDWPWHAGCSIGGGVGGGGEGGNCGGNGGNGNCPAATAPNCPYPDPAYSVFFPHPTDCHWFYHCSNGVAYCKECPSGLFWNVDLDTCDWPWNAGCRPGGGGNGGGNTGENDDCPAGETPTCPSKDPAYSVFFPHANDCHYFYHCSNGVAYCKVCPAGLHWNAKLDTCDWPESAGCTNNNNNNNGGGNVKPPAGAGCPVPQPAFNVYFADPYNCSIFYQCSNGVAYQQKCPAGLHFNPSKNVCDYPEEAGCSNSESEVTTKSEPEEPAATCPSATPPKCPVTNPDVSVYFPHPDSHWFFHCSHGVAYCKSCPSGLQWNQNKELCDW